jgi:hypothetical protein
MKSLLALLMVLLACPALAQPGPGGRMHRQPGPPPGYQQQQRDFRPMPPPARRMGWEERQRLREDLRGGQMSREEARERWREERARRELGPGRSIEERQRLRRDVMEANRALERR